MLNASLLSLFLESRLRVKSANSKVTEKKEQREEPWCLNQNSEIETRSREEEGQRELSGTLDFFLSFFAIPGKLLDSTARTNGSASDAMCN